MRNSVLKIFALKILLSYYSYKIFHPPANEASRKVTNSTKRKNPAFIKPIDVDKDEGGIYKARHNKNQDIKEIPDSEDMHLDLPISRRKAEEIDNVT